MNNSILFTLSSLAFLLCYVIADVKFPKDQSSNHRWPPLIYKHDSGRIPDGHLRPFGYQKKSEGKAKEFESSLHASDFYTNCVQQNIPCLFQDVMNETEPMLKWEDKHIENEIGKKNVSVERFLADKSKQKAKVSIRHFIRNYHHKEMFIRSTVPKELEQDVPIPTMINCGTFRESTVEVVLWASSGFTPSRLHFDAESQLHCLLDGRKDFVLYDPKHSEIFKLQETFKGSGAGFCPWNPEILSVYENPKLSKTPWKYATLWPGDCPYIPQGYLHQVRAHSRSWSLAYHWMHTDTVEFEDCESTPDDVRLSETEIFWTYVNGDKQIREHIITAPNLKKYLLLIARPTKGISFLKFYHFVIEANENYKDFDDGEIEDPTAVISPREMFEKLLTDKTADFVSVEEIENVTDEVLEELALMVTPPHVDEPSKDEL